jgi:hypothetical protein
MRVGMVWHIEFEPEVEFSQAVEMSPSLLLKRPEMG